MPLANGLMTRAEREAEEMVRVLEPTARKELSAMLMTKRLETALRIGGRDITGEDLAAVARVMMLEALGMFYRAKAKGDDRGDDQALRALKEARGQLVTQAQLLGKLQRQPDPEDQAQNAKVAAAFEVFARTPEGRAALEPGKKAISSAPVTLDVTRVGEGQG